MFLLSIEFINPPKAILASGTKKGVELGGDKSILSVDGKHNLYNEGTIFTEMSWAEFYQEQGLEDQIDTFQTTEYTSVRDDPDALVNTIAESMNKIIKNNRIFYGIIDFEVDAFLNQNCVIPGLKLDYGIINKLMTKSSVWSPLLLRTVHKFGLSHWTFCFAPADFKTEPNNPV